MTFFSRSARMPGWLHGLDTRAGDEAMRALSSVAGGAERALGATAEEGQSAQAPALESARELFLRTR